MPAPARLFDDPDFRALPRDRQREFFASIEPDFAALSPDSQNTFLDARAPKPTIAQTVVRDLEQLAFPEGRAALGRAALSGLKEGIAGNTNLIANLLEGFGGAPGREPGPNAGMIANLVGADRETTRKLLESAAPDRGKGILGAGAEIAGGLIPSLVPAFLASEIAGPVAGLAGLGAASAIDQGKEAAAREGIKGGLLGGVFKATHGLPVAVSAPAVGAATYALSVGQPDTTRRVLDAATMAALSVIGPGPRLPQRVVSAEMEARASEIRRRIDEPKPLAPEPPVTEPVPPVAGPIEPPVVPVPVEQPPAPRPQPPEPTPAPGAPESPPVAAPEPVPAPEAPTPVTPPPPAAPAADFTQQEREALAATLADVQRGGVEMKLPTRPILDILKKRGGVDPKSGLASELRALGVEKKGVGSMPGLFRVGGLKALDDLDIANEPVLIGNVRPVSHGSPYVFSRDLLDAIDAELRGHPLRSEDQLAAIAKAEQPMHELRRFLDVQGIDPKTATVDQVLEAHRRLTNRLIEGDEVRRPQDQGEPSPSDWSPADLIMRRVPAAGEPPPDARARAGGGPGVNYVGDRDFTPQNIDVPMPKKIVSAGDALERLARALKIPVQQGNLRALSREPTLQGYARANLTRLGEKFRGKALQSLRVRKWGDIQTATHEIFHVLDSRIRALSEWYDPRLNKGPDKSPTQAQREVNALSYDVSKPYEGGAEFARLWFTQRPELEQKAPTALREFDQLIKTTLSPKEVKAMLRAQKEMHAYFEQGAQAAGRTVIGRNNTAGSVLSTEFDRLRAVTADRFHGILMADRMVHGGDPTAPDRVWATFKELDRISSLEEGLILEGAPRWVGAAGPNTEIEFVGEGVATILGRVAKSPADLADFYHYALARMADIAGRHGIKTPYTKEMIRDGVARETPAFKRAYDELAEMRENVLKFAIASGQFSADQAAEWRFRGEMAWSLLRERGAPPGTGGGVRKLLQERGVYQMRGSSRNFVEPLDAILGGSSKLIRMSLENIAVKQLYTDVLKAPGGGRLGEHIPAERMPVKLSARAIEDAVSDSVKQALGVTTLPDGWLSKNPAMNEFLEVWVGGQAPRDKLQRVFSYRENGRPVYFEIFDPVLAHALTSMRKEPAGDALRILGAIPRRLYQHYVTVHPKFIYRQLFRDMVSATVQSRTGAQSVTSSIVGWGEAMRRHSDLQRKMQANLGAGSEFRHSDVKGTTKYIIRKGRRATAATPGEKARVGMLDITNPVNYFRALEAFGKGVERGPRLGEANRSIKRGEGARIAARRYAEVTTDFAGEGSGRIIDQNASRKEHIAAAWTKIGIHTVPFYRAMINSFDKLLRDVVTAKDWRGTVTSKIAIVALSQVALAAFLFRDKDYADIPEEMKNANIYVGKVNLGTDAKPDMHWLTLPSTYELGALARGITRTLELWLESGDRDLVQYAQDMMQIAGNVFGVSLPVIPGAILEQYTNRTGMGFPIESEGQQNLEPYYRTGPGVPATLEAAARVQRHLPEGAPQLSPARANALLRSFLGNWVAAGFAIPDYVLFPERRMDTRWTEMSMAPPFTQRVGKYSQADQDFYALADSVHETVSTARAAELRNDPTIRDEQLDNPEYRLQRYISRAERVISDLRNQAEGAKRDPSLTPMQRREESEAKRLEIQELERQVLEQARSLKRELAGEQK